MAKMDPNDPMRKRFEKGKEPPVKKILIIIGIIGFIVLMGVMLTYLFAGLK